MARRGARRTNEIDDVTGGIIRRCVQRVAQGNTSTRGVDVEGMVVVRVEVWVWRVSVIAPEHRGEYSQMGWLRSQWKTAWYRTAGMGSVFTALFAVLLL
jgi:hypothetical protein